MSRPPLVAVDLRAAIDAPTGIGVYTVALLEALATRGNMRFLGLAHRPPTVASRLADAGIGCEVQSAPSGVWWQQLVLPKRLARGDIDLFWSPLQTLPLRGRLRSVVTVHDLTPLTLPEAHRLKVRWSQLPFLGHSLHRASRVLAVSQTTADDVRHFYPEAAPRLRVVHNGVSPRFQPASPADIAAIRQRLGAPDGYLLYAGTLEPRKNVPLILDAWEALVAEEEGTPPLLLAGAYGWKSHGLMARLQRLAGKGVRALGRVDEDQLVELMQAASAFVYPSLYEGFGLPAVEAMACGVPTVVSDAGSLPEVVGDGALRVPANDPGQLAGVLQRILHAPDLARDLSERGRRRASRYSWDACADAHEVIFREALTAPLRKPGNGRP